MTSDLPKISALPAGHDPSLCPRFHAAIELIGRRWTGAILSILAKSGEVRFSDVQGAIPELSARLLTERLRELEESGIVARHVSSDRPVRVSYSLTDKGVALQPVLDGIGAWAETWADGPGQGDAV